MYEDLSIMLVERSQSLANILILASIIFKLSNYFNEYVHLLNSYTKLKKNPNRVGFSQFNSLIYSFV